MPSNGSTPLWDASGEEAHGQSLDPAQQSTLSAIHREFVQWMDTAATTQSGMSFGRLVGGSASTSTANEAASSRTAASTLVTIEAARAAMSQGLAARARGDAFDAMRYYDGAIPMRFTSSEHGGLSGRDATHMYLDEYEQHIRPKEQKMDMRQIGYILEEQVQRAVDQRFRDVRAMAPPPLTIDTLKALLKQHPDVMMDMVKECCSDAAWVSGLLDHYFSAEPTPIFTEAVKEALSPTGETSTI